MRQRILNLLKIKGDLPPLPEIVLRLQSMVKDPQKSIKDIAKLIEYDPVMAGRIINLSNSVYYTRSQTLIKTLPVAISKIGLNMLLKLVYSLKISNLFSDNSVLDCVRFWRHSFAVAIFTQSLCNKIKANREEQDIAYLAGLMHDIGIMVFIYLIPNEYSDFLKKAKEKEIPIEQQEKEAFDIDHGELGSIFIENWWHIDKKVCQAVLNHHNPFQGDGCERKCAQLVHISNGICNNVGIYNGTGCFTESFKEAAWQELGFTLDELEIILTDVNSLVEQAEELINMARK
jgi:HD-like signal output (HDOD) protein